MSIFTRAAGVLGMNARNLLYVSKFNPRESKRFADDKLMAKNFLESRGIGVAKMYHSLSSHTQLQNFDPKTLPSSFVIKPNRGYGGEGIIVVDRTKGKKYTTINGDEFTWEHLYNHCTAIIDGKYAISGLHDKVIFEERLERHHCFDGYADVGLPDIRIIVFNHVPVAAMLRVPTIESEGKANLHVGGIGIGIDIGTGKTTSALRYQKYIRKMPTGTLARDFQIPSWNKILLTATKIQHATKIGYLAADIALSTNGIKVLEVNARAGLAIQLANRLFLRNRLDKVKDLKVLSPEEGVEIAKTLFSEKSAKTRQSSRERDNREILSMVEAITLLESKPVAILTQIDLHSEHNYIDQKLTQKEGEEVFDIMIKDKRYKLPFKITDRSTDQYKVILSGKYLRDFLIDPRAEHGKLPEVHKTIKKKKDESMLSSLDNKVCNLDSEIKLLSFFRPLNLEEEKEKFFNNHHYNPQFIYKPLNLDLDAIRRELSKISTDIDHPFASLYQSKIEEMNQKLNLIEARDSAEMEVHCEQIFGQTSQKDEEHCRSLLKNQYITERDDKAVPFKSAIKRFQEELKQRKLNHWKIKIQENAVTRMQVNKANTIFIGKNAKFKELAIEPLIAHEIETHIYRFENGKLQKLKIFQRGTANYLETEEGLAVYNEKRVSALREKSVRSALSIVGAHHGKNMTFSELFLYLTESFSISSELAWKVCIKLKRGCTDTRSPFVFTKDIIYYNGYKKISHLVKAKGESILKELYKGKIAIADLPIIQKADLLPPRYWPYKES
jgi:alpha-L-glutamate ligase-like protein/uncharacterized protein (TIGR02421 family)